jgi:phage terminase Nu1 subunit (DNA packaging protein)
MPVVTRGRRGQAGEYDASACLKWYRQHKIGSLELERTRREKSQADLNEAKLARQRGQVIDVETVKLDWARYIGNWQNYLLGLPNMAAERLPHLTREDDDVLEDIVRRALEVLADGVGPSQSRDDLACEMDERSSQKWRILARLAEWLRRYLPENPTLLAASAVARALPP